MTMLGDTVNKMNKTDPTTALMGHLVHKHSVGPGEYGQPHKPKGQSM